MNSEIFVRTLGNQVTVYDNEGKIVRQIPEPPPVPPKVSYFNIVEFEDKLMGKDPDEKPDFFIDFETDERFRDITEDPEFIGDVKYLDFKNTVELITVTLCFASTVLFGYLII